MRLTSLAIAALLVALGITTAAVARLENYRYANFLGMCSAFDLKDPAARIKREACLDDVQTRTAWVWHVVYGLKIM